MANNEIRDDQNFFKLDKEAYLIAFEGASDDPSNFSLIPSGIHQYTYTTSPSDSDEEKKKPTVGKKRYRLSALAISLYVLIKSLTNEKIGTPCWASEHSLAEMMGCSEKTLRKAKKELLQPIEQLNGKSLISIIYKKKHGLDRDGRKIVTPYHLIRLESIWKEHKSFSSVRREKKDREHPHENVHKPDGSVNFTGRSRDLSVNFTGRFRSDHPVKSTVYTENRETEKLCIRTETEKAAGASESSGAVFCSSTLRSSVPNKKFQEKDVDIMKALEELRRRYPDQEEDFKEYASTQNQPKKQAKLLAESCTKENAKILLEGFGCDYNMIKETLRRYSPNQIFEAIDYTKHMMQRQNIKNKPGYLRKTLEKGHRWGYSGD